MSEPNQRVCLLSDSEVAAATNGSGKKDVPRNYGSTTMQEDDEFGSEDDDGVNFALLSQDSRSSSSSSSSNGDDDDVKPDPEMPILTIAAILATAFSYGCVFTTLFLIALPIECERISLSSSVGTPKSIALGVFVAIAGFTQLVSPLIGRVSDMYEPPRLLTSRTRSSHSHTTFADIGQRLPYYMIGGVIAAVGLICQMFSSYAALWLRYTFAFFFSLVGLNIQYAMMLALIPDQVPRSQTGVANGILALLLVTGSLFGFGLFHSLLYENVASMYALYASIVIITSCLTGTHAHEQDAELSALRMKRLQRSAQHQPPAYPISRSLTPDEDEPSNSHYNASSPTRSRRKRWHKKARRVAKRVTKRAIAKAREIVLPPALIVNSIAAPLRKLNCSSLLACYTIDIDKHHDFFVVTISRLFYYCGMSVQTFFLYFVHDIIHIRTNPEAAVATLAIIGQCSGAFTCYPVGALSDYVLGGRRTPFVYLSCLVLAGATLTLVFATTMDQMIFFCMVLGAANGMYLTMETSLAVDTLQDVEDLGDDNEENGSDGEHDDEHHAQLLGIWGVAAFLGSAIGPMVGGPLLYIFGSTDDDDSNEASEASSNGEPVPEEYSLTGYAVVLSLSAFYFVCSAVSLQFLRKQHS